MLYRIHRYLQRAKEITDLKPNMQMLPHEGNFYQKPLKCTLFFRHRLDGWMICDFTSISTVFPVISGRWASNNEMLCAMETRFRLKRPPLRAGLERGTARSVGQLLAY